MCLNRGVVVVAQVAPALFAASRFWTAAAPAVPVSGLTSKIERLSELHASGALTDEEFAAAKQRLLAK